MKKKLLLLLISCSLVLSLIGCNKTVSVDVPNENEPVSEEEPVSDEEPTKPEKVEAPVFYEDFEGDTNTAILRGDGLSFDIVDDGMDGSKALCISGRTETWNGANFACEEFRGNEIQATANLKGMSKALRISIQYDVNGATSYNWVANCTGGNLDKYGLATGKFTIPKDAENIFVYVESDTCDDIYVDNMKVEVVGTYTPYLEIAEKEWADISSYKSLKDIYADYFEVGVCVNPVVIKDEHYSPLILKEFSSVTCENNMKPEGILKRTESIEALPESANHIVVDMSGCVEELEFAKANGLKVRGHCLVWHSQTPDWIFYEDYDTSKELASRKVMLERLDNYMKDVFTWADENYPGLFYAWDVVNEAMEDNGKMRESFWYQTIGEDYLEQVFKSAKKYAPDYIKLFYNDYNSYQNSKQEGIIKVLTPIAEAGNIDGVGMQGHLYTGEDPTHFAKCAKRYADELGVIIHVTEVDVSQPSSMNPEGDQGLYYGNLFKALKDAKKDGVPIESVSVWGISDGLSWKASEKPLMFNDDLSGKLAFFEVVQAGEKE